VLVQINFSVKGSFLPADHNYALYAALINFNPLLRSPNGSKYVPRKNFLHGIKLAWNCDRYQWLDALLYNDFNDCNKM
jgi:hypothetical protein